MGCRLWGCGEVGDGMGGSSWWEREELSYQDVLRRFVDIIVYAILRIGTASLPPRTHSIAHLRSFQ